jgi:glutamate-1-semialdehyde 2,1-aminomutase
MPVGAFGASRAIMSRLAPDGDTYQAGTLSGNPVAMTAGIATLDVLERESTWNELEVLGARLEQLLTRVVAAANFPLHVVRLGSMLWLSLHDTSPLRCAATLSPEAATRFKKLFHALLGRGIYIAPSAYEVLFVSQAHCEDDLQRFAAALTAAVAVANA